MSLKPLPPPDYTDDEKNSLIDFLLALKSHHTRDFLMRANLPKSGTKPQLRERLEAALAEGNVRYEQIVELLDAVTPWGKQHVFLYSGPQGDLRSWKDPDLLLQHLKDHRVGKYLNARLPLILPDKLTLSSIAQQGGRVRITAVQKREYVERVPEYDDEKKTRDGVPISLRAYITHVSRTLVTFEWDLTSNTAMLQITQLHGDRLYEEVRTEFFVLVKDWLDIEKTFGLVDIRKTIGTLHELEQNGRGETRSHGIDYESPQGRTVSARSPSPQDSVLGETKIDKGMQMIREESVGRLGNFYWLANASQGPVTNPLTGDVHVVLVAGKSRINFRTPNTESVVRYVLHRVRALS